MNARQAKKRLKKEISRLKRDNALMRSIIDDSEAMSDLYNRFTEPVKVQHITMQMQKFCSRRSIPKELECAIGIHDITRRALENDIFEGIKNWIDYDVVNDGNVTTYTATVYVGRK